MGSTLGKETQPYVESHERLVQLQKQQITRSQRFITNSQLIANNKDDFIQYNQTTYSNNGLHGFGYYFRYDDAAKNKDDEHFCCSRYQTFKQEMIENQICTENVWKNALKNANEMLYDIQKHNANNSISYFDKFGINRYAMNHPHYNKQFDIAAYTEITAFHLLAVMLYFNSYSLATTLSKTFRKWDPNENIKVVKNRHSHFVHISNYILQTIYLYGNELSDDAEIYRGILCKSFEGFDAPFSGPVSCTTSKRKAMEFAAPIGCVMELKNSEVGCGSMYIDGTKGLSAYTTEREYLFYSPYFQICNVYPLRFQRSTFNFRKHITAMILLQRILCGQELSQQEQIQLDRNDIKETLQKITKWNITKLNVNEVKPEIEYVHKWWRNNFNYLMKQNRYIWINRNIKLDAKMIRSITCSIPKHKLVKFCNRFKWKIAVKQLKYLLDTNTKIPVLVKGYLRENAFCKQKNKTVIMLIQLYADSVLQCDDLCISRINFANKIFDIRAFMTIYAKQSIENNEWYDLIFTIDEYPEFLKNIMYSMEIRCDELNILWRFENKELSKYTQRGYSIRKHKIQRATEEHKSISIATSYRFYQATDN